MCRRNVTGAVLALLTAFLSSACDFHCNQSISDTDQDSPPHVSGELAFGRYIQGEREKLSAHAFPSLPGAARKILLRTLQVAEAIHDRGKHPLYIRELSRSRQGKILLLNLDFLHRDTGHFQGVLLLPKNASAPGASTLVFPSDREAGRQDILDRAALTGLGGIQELFCAPGDKVGPVLILDFPAPTGLEDYADNAALQLARGVSQPGMRLLMAHLAMDYLAESRHATPCRLRVAGFGPSARLALQLIIADERIAELVMDDPGQSAFPFDDPTRSEAYSLDAPGALILAELDDMALLKSLIPLRGFCIRSGKDSEIREHRPLSKDFRPVTGQACQATMTERRSIGHSPGIPAPSTVVDLSDGTPRGNTVTLFEKSKDPDQGGRRGSWLDLAQSLRIADYENASVEDMRDGLVHQSDGRVYSLVSEDRQDSDRVLLLSPGTERKIVRRLKNQGFSVSVTYLPGAHRIRIAGGLARRLLWIDRSIGGMYVLQALEILKWMKGEGIIVIGQGPCAPVALFAAALSPNCHAGTVEADWELTKLAGWAIGPAAFRREKILAMISSPAAGIIGRLRRAGVHVP